MTATVAGNRRTVPVDSNLLSLSGICMLKFRIHAASDPD